jgi:hypothetical protein
MATTYNKLSELQKQFYGSISFGGSDGNIVPSDVLGSNKWIGLRVNVAGTLKVRKLNGQIQDMTVFAGEYLPFAVDTVYSTGTTATVLALMGLTEEVDDVYT